MWLRLLLHIIIIYLFLSGWLSMLTFRKGTWHCVNENIENQSRKSIYLYDLYIILTWQKY